MRRSRSAWTRSTRSKVLRTRWPVSAEVKTKGIQRRNGVRARAPFSIPGAVEPFLSTRSQVLTTRMTPQPESHAASATFTSCLWMPEEASVSTRQTSASRITRVARSHA